MKCLKLLGILSYYSLHIIIGVPRKIAIAASRHPKWKFFIWLGAAAVLALAWGLPASGALNPYVVQILMYVGINMILTLSLNLVNGYMGEFSVGHAGFMGIGAYVASVLTVAVLPGLGTWWLSRGPHLRWRRRSAARS